MFQKKIKHRKIELTNQKPSDKQLDQLVSKIIRLRDKTCVVCGSSQFLQTAHFITRGNKAVRWDLDNVFLLCSGCHMMRNESWHKNPNYAVEFVKLFLGEERYNNLIMRARTVRQKIDRWSVELYLKQEFNKYGKV